MKQIIFLFSIFISTCLLKTNAQSLTKDDKPGESLQVTTSRMLRPAGKLISLGDSTKENHALDCSLSPDNKWLAVEERFSIIFINTAKNEVVHILRLDKIPELKNAMNTYSGISWFRKDNVDYVLFSCSNTQSDSYVVQLKWDGKTAGVTNLFLFKPKEQACFIQLSEKDLILHSYAALSTSFSNVACGIFAKGWSALVI